MNAQRSWGRTLGQRDLSLWVIARRLLIVMGLGLGIYLVFGGDGWRSAPTSGSGSRQDVAAGQRELKAVRGELAMARTQHQVDRQALELVRRELASQQEHISDLEENLRFYKSLMAPGSVTNGVTLRSLELVAHELSGEISFRIIVQQVARKHPLVAGTLSAAIDGVLDGQQVSLPLTELVAETADINEVLQFRYFQVYEGNMHLPVGLEPLGVTVTLKTKKPESLDIREQFPWQLQERFSHVGK